MYRHTYIGIETHRHTDGQTKKRTDRQILYIDADSRTAGKQAVGQTDLQTERQTYIKKNSFEIFASTFWQLFMQASRQAGGLAGRKAGRKAGRRTGRSKADRQAGRKAGGQEGRNAGGQKCRYSRQTDRGTERQMYKYAHRQTEINTYRHTQTNRQTYRQCKVLVQAEKQTMCRKTNIYTYCMCRLHRNRWCED